MKTNTIINNNVELLIDESINENRNVSAELSAVATKNPNISWMEFVLLDDLPNGNGERVPAEEFDRIIESGLHMPIKMANGEIKPGHKDSTPIGVITNLVREGNRIIGLAALWLKERVKDIELLKDLYANKYPLNLSWEMEAYKDTREDGTTDLKEAVLNAVTLVGMPAYQGRTPVLAIASQNEEDGTLDELETLKQQLAELQASFDALKAENEEMKTKQETADAELTQLREYKASIEAEQSKIEKFEAIKVQFVEAGLEMDSDYFESKKEELLAMDESAVNFFIKELASLSKTLKAETSASAVPNLSGQAKKMTPKELGKLLRESKI